MTFNYTEEALRALLDGATPGPWKKHSEQAWSGTVYRVGTPFVKSERYGQFSETVCEIPNSSNDRENARLIAAAPSLVADSLALHEELARVRAENEALKEERWRYYLDMFQYEDWDGDHDGNMRVGDWVELNWQDHNGTDRSHGVGKVVAHHDFEIPILIQVEGFESDGEPHGTYVPLALSGYNTIRPITEERARALLEQEPG